MGATIMMYEGAPDTPDRSRFWSIVERHRVTILYTAPTAIRTFVRWGDDWVNKHDLSSLRLLGSVGEPINPEAWMWYREVVGKSRCPIVDTYWQTETGCTVLGPLPGAIDQKPGSCGRPYYGISPKVLRDDGSEAPVDEPGFLVIDRPWPGMFRTLWNNDARYRSAYFERFENVYLTGDAARRDADGYFWIVGRTDDVVNVSGHRLGTAEIESVLVAHPSVAEAAVVAAPDPVTGEALVAFVTPRGDVTPSSELAEALAAHVASQIGRFARPKQVRLADALPKTRSGKIMRRLLRDLAAGREVRGDVTTLEDASVLDQLRGDGTPA
jgi:acetyl-CoA synthetase